VQWTRGFAPPPLDGFASSLAMRMGRHIFLFYY
jgi:hypothetical protein